MNELISTRYLRLSQIIGNKKISPAIPPIIPVGKTTWWRGVKTGRYPKPIKLGSRLVAWRIEDINAVLKYGMKWTDAQKETQILKAE